MIPALVLTAGLATRLRPLSYLRAKAVLPVAGEPLVRRILRWLHASGVADVVLNLHHLPHTVTRTIGDGSDLGLQVRYSWEDPVLGSAGGPRRALPLLVPGGVPNSRFLIVNGDTLTDVDVAAVVDRHRHSGALVTLAVVPNREPGRYGGVLVDEQGWVTGFVRRGSDLPSYHFIGVQVAEAAAFGSVPDGVPHESVTALYPALIAARRDGVQAYVCSAEFLDIGTPGDYLRTSLLLSVREGALPSPGQARISGTARVEQSVLWDDVDVGDGAVVKGCIVCDRVHVPANTTWTDVILRCADGMTALGEQRIGELVVCKM